MPRRAVRRRRRARLRVMAAALATAGLTGCTSDSPPEAPAPTETPLSAIDLSGLDIPRTGFCGVVDPDSVAALLGGPPRRTAAYGNGDRVVLAPGLRDVSHEYGCSYRRGQRSARAWVFAQPVTPGQARRLVAERRRTDGCSPAGELAFGSPGSAQLCREAGSRTVTMAGLFGTAWFTCEVRTASTPDAGEDVDAAQRWCAGVSTAAATG